MATQGIRKSFKKFADTVCDKYYINSLDDMKNFLKQRNLNLKEHIDTVLEMVGIEYILKNITEQDMMYEDDTIPHSILLRKGSIISWNLIIDSRLPPPYQNYLKIVALGHWTLHRFNKSIFHIRISENTGTEEKDALDFAIKIMVPQESLEKKINNDEKNIKELSKYFGVPWLLMLKRAKSLGYKINQKNKE